VAFVVNVCDQLEVRGISDEGDSSPLLCDEDQQGERQALLWRTLLLQKHFFSVVAVTSLLVCKDGFVIQILDGTSLRIIQSHQQ
jgi:hypothetical protein